MSSLMVAPCVSRTVRMQEGMGQDTCNIWWCGMKTDMSASLKMIDSQNIPRHLEVVSFVKGECKFWRGPKRSTSPWVGTTHAAGPNDISQPPESTTFSLDNDWERERERDWFSNLCSVLFLFQFFRYLCVYTFEGSLTYPLLGIAGKMRAAGHPIWKKKQAMGPLASFAARHFAAMVISFFHSILGPSADGGTVPRKRNGNGRYCRQLHLHTWHDTHSIHIYINIA